MNGLIANCVAIVANFVNGWQLQVTLSMSAELVSVSIEVKCVLLYECMKGLVVCDCIPIMTAFNSH